MGKNQLKHPLVQQNIITPLMLNGHFKQSRTTNTNLQN